MTHHHSRPVYSPVKAGQVYLLFYRQNRRTIDGLPGKLYRITKVRKYGKGGSGTSQVDFLDIETRTPGSIHQASLRAAWALEVPEGLVDSVQKLSHAQRRALHQQCWNTTVPIENGLATALRAPDREHDQTISRPPRSLRPERIGLTNRQIAGMMGAAARWAKTPTETSVAKKSSTPNRAMKKSTTSISPTPLRAPMASPVQTSAPEPQTVSLVGGQKILFRRATAEFWAMHILRIHGGASPPFVLYEHFMSAPGVTQMIRLSDLSPKDIVVLSDEDARALAKDDRHASREALFKMIQTREAQKAREAREAQKKAEADKAAVEIEKSSGEGAGNARDEFAASLKMVGMALTTLLESRAELQADIKSLHTRFDETSVRPTLVPSDQSKTLAVLHERVTEIKTSLERIMKDNALTTRKVDAMEAALSTARNDLHKIERALREPATMRIIHHPPSNDPAVQRPGSNSIPSSEARTPDAPGGGDTQA